MTPFIARRKAAHLRAKLKKCEIFCMQEAHGSRAKLKEALRHELQDYRLFHSPGTSRAKGGTATLIAKSFLGVGTDAVMETYAEGRIHRTHICDTYGTEKIVVWDVHYYDIESRTLTAIMENETRQMLGCKLSASQGRYSCRASSSV